MTYTLALTPTAPALLQPTRALLTIAGEYVAEVDYRREASAPQAFAQTERIGVGRLLATAGNQCRSCGFAHALALCQAVELLAKVEPPPRAAWLRVAAAELERARSHLATLAAIFAAMGMEALRTAFALQAEQAGQTFRKLVGEQPGAWLTPGGISRNLPGDEVERLADAAAGMLAALFPLAEGSITQRPLLARTVDVGTISGSAATQFGLAGPMARAAGSSADLRNDAPYAAYATLRPVVAPQEGGDVYARMLTLLLEALEALKLVERAARELPEGPWGGALPDTLPAGSAEASVEAPRGPLRYKIESDGKRIVSVTYTTAPQLDRLLARTVLASATIDDVALIIVSTDPCDGCLTAA